MQVKYFNGQVAVESDDDAFTRITLGLIKGIVYAVTRWYIAILICLLIALSGVAYLFGMDSISEAPMGLFVIVIGIVGMYASYKYLRHNEITFLESKNGASIREIKKRNKKFYDDFSMNDEERTKSAHVSQIMINYFLTSNIYDLNAKGKMYKDLYNRMYEVVSVPDVAVLYHYDQSGQYDYNSKIVIWAEPRFVEKLMDIETELNTALAIANLENLKIVESSLSNNVIIWEIEDLNQNDGFDFTKGD